MSSEVITKNDLKNVLENVLPPNEGIHIGSQIDIGTATLNANGWLGFSLGNSVPDGALVISYLVYWSTNTGAFAVPAYNNGMGRTQYICGTPNCTINGLKITPVYIMP